MSVDDVQQLCAQGQDLLVKQQYAEAEQTLARAEREAYRLEEWDALSRLYMPLQEARRQRRQCAAEGVICLNLISQGPDDQILGRHVVENYPHGQLLVAGWGSIEPALQVRKLQARFHLYIDVLLAAVYPLRDNGRAVVIVPHERVVLPDVNPRHLDDFRRVLQPGCIVIRTEDLPQNLLRGDTSVQSRIDGWWESLSHPYLFDAREARDLRKRIDGYRKVIRVDYACELAHQELSATARALARMTPTR